MTMAVDNEEQARSKVGAVLKDKWRLDTLLGIGGMAVVYAATHRNQKRVAIKMLLPELAGQREVRERFVREGYAANTIEHPGAVSVLDDDVTEDGQPFLVMELLEGQTVEKRWEDAGRQLELPEVLAIAGAVLEVLAAAHAKGVVHRDIKPENLFLLSAGGLKVLDFGIARVLEAAAQGQTATRAGTVMGTPAFMAPEQALAKWDEVDGRTDLWAVGATMFTLISGAFVHEGATGNEQLVKSATQPARSLASVTKGVPRSIVALVDRSLKFDRTTRWPDARAMKEAVAGAFEALTGAPLVIEVAATSAVLDRSPGSRRTASGSFPGPAAPAGPASPRRPPGPPPPTRRASTAGIAATLPAQKAPPPPPPRRSSGSFEVADSAVIDMSSGARGLAPPSMDALGVDAYVAGRTAERDAAAAEVARFQPTVAEIQSRLAAVRRRVAQAQEQIAAARKQRMADEEVFRRQTNARLEGVGEARRGYRKAMGEVARMALEDAANFPAGLAAAERAAIVSTGEVATARTGESALYEAALASFEPNAFKSGLMLLGIGGLLFLLFFFSPVLIRSCSSDTGTIYNETPLPQQP